jgi:hypothetical protein
VKAYYRDDKLIIIFAHVAIVEFEDENTTFIFTSDRFPQPIKFEGAKARNFAAEYIAWLDAQSPKKAMSVQHGVWECSYREHLGQLKGTNDLDGQKFAAGYFGCGVCKNDDCCNDEDHVCFMSFMPIDDEPI